MLDLISLSVTLIIMILFGIGILMMLIIMSHEKTDLEQQYDDDEQIKYIIDWQEKQQRKKELRKQIINNFKNKIKILLTRR